jgi:hypothetical protein
MTRRVIKEGKEGNRKEDGTEQKFENGQLSDHTV